MRGKEIRAVNDDDRQSSIRERRGCGASRRNRPEVQKLNKHSGKLHPRPRNQDLRDLNSSGSRFVESASRPSSFSSPERLTQATNPK
jgi:hypothetical protein